MEEISREEALAALARLKQETLAEKRLSGAVAILQARLVTLGDREVSEAFDALDVQWA